jgi:hypothetical protein
MSHRRCKSLMFSQERARTVRPLNRRDGAAVRSSALVGTLSLVHLSDTDGPHNKQLRGRAAAHIPSRRTFRL